MPMSASPCPSTIWMTPSAPTPNRRSHSARTSSPGIGPVDAASMRIRKSFPAPWCLVKRRRDVWGSGVVMTLPRSLSPTYTPRVTRRAPVRSRGRGRVRSDPDGAASRQSGDQQFCDRCGRVLVRVEPCDPRVPSEPCPLSTGELTGPTHGLVDGLGQWDPVLHVGQELAVAECLTGGP